MHAVVEACPTFEDTQRMRILSLSSIGAQCGIGDYNAKLTTALRTRGHEVDILALVRRGDRAPMLHELGRRIAKYDAAILHYDDSLYGDTVAERLGNFATVVRLLGERPAIAILHEDLPVIPAVARRQLIQPWSRSFLQTWRELLARISLINTRPTMINAMNNGLTMLVHGESQRQRWTSAGIALKKIKAIIYPLQPSTPLIEPQPLGETDPVRLTMFGFVTEYKGYEIALNAMRILPENYVLTIAGDRLPEMWGDRTIDAIHGFIETGRWLYRTQYSAIATTSRPYSDAERRSMQARIKLIGYVPTKEIAALMNRTDIMLVPYRRSCGSAALADAIGFARPTITTALPAFRDIAEHANCFRMVTPDAPFELAHAIRELALDLNERRRMFEASQVFAYRHNFAALAQYCASIFVDSISTQHAKARPILQMAE